MSRGRLCDAMDQVTTKAQGRKPSGSRYVGLEHIESGARTLIGTAPSSFSQGTNGVFAEGDVLFGKLRPNLRKAVQVGFGGYCSTDLLVLRPKMSVDAQYAGHVATSEWVFRHAEQNSIGTRMPRTSWHAVSQAPVWLPPLEEQRRIAEILDTIDESIQAIERLITKHERIRSGLATDLLSGRWSMAEWQEGRLGDIGTVVGGGTPSRERPEYWNGTIPWLTPRELAGNRDKYIMKTTDRITEQGLAKSGARLVPAGSLLVTSRASIGICALAGRSLATNQGFKNLIPGMSVDASFLFYLGQTLNMEMTRRASGTTFLEISSHDFQQIRICLPPLKEQRRIATILDSAGKIIRAYERERDKLQQLRSGLASDLLSGRVRTVAV